MKKATSMNLILALCLSLALLVTACTGADESAPPAGGDNAEAAAPTADDNADDVAPTGDADAGAAGNTNILGGANGYLEKQYDSLLLAYTNEAIADDALYEAWWDEFTDIQAVAGLGESIRLVRDDGQREGHMPQWEYMIAFGFSGDVQAMAAAVESHALESDSALWFYEAIGELVDEPWQDTDTEEHFFMALTNPKPGVEEEFNTWYDENHIPDVVGVSCYRSGRRYRMAAQCGDYAPWEYLALYRFVGTAQDMHTTLRAEAGTFVMSELYDPDDGAWIFSVV